MSPPINGHTNRPVARGLDKPAISGSGRRKTGRRLQESLQSNLGPILDLSAGGVRVLCNREHTGLCTLDIEGHETSISLQGEVVWCRRLAFRRFELGIQFQDVDSELARKLTDIASAHAAQHWRAA